MVKVVFTTYIIYRILNIFKLIFFPAKKFKSLKSRRTCDYLAIKVFNTNSLSVNNSRAFSHEAETAFKVDLLTSGLRNKSAYLWKQQQYPDLNDV